MTRRSAALGLAAALGLLAGARLTREELRSQVAHWPKSLTDPFAPSAGAAPYISLGYRELAADLFWLRLRVYVGNTDVMSSNFRGLVEAVVALDPDFAPIYDWAGYLVSWLDSGVTQDDYRWVVGLLERGLQRFPDRWQIQKVAGETYLLELKTDDPAQALAWKERGVELLEHAIHNSEAPKALGSYVAYIQSQLGETQRAVDGITELIRTTDDPGLRKKLIARLAAIQGASADQIAAEDQLLRDRLDRAWKRALPEAPLEAYLLLGDPPKPYLDPADWVAQDVIVLDRDLLAPVTDDKE